MKNKNLLLSILLMITTFILLLSIFVGCGGASSDNKNSQESNSSNYNTLFIDDTEFQDGIENGKIVLINSESYKDKLKERKKREAELDTFIRKFKYEHPEVSLDMLKSPDVNQSDITKLPDGNYNIKVRLNNGAEMHTITLGEYYAKESFVDTIIKYPTYDNQISLYRTLLNNMPKQLKKELDLPSLKLIKEDTGFYTTDEIKGLVKQIVQKIKSIGCDNTESMGGDIQRVCPNGDENESGIVLVEGGDAPSGYVSNYDDEIGIGAFKYDHDNNNCTYSQYGIFKNYKASYWPLKYYLTSVKDQGHRGACVAFSITAAMETSIAVKYHMWTNLSEQALYNKMKFNWERNDFTEGFFIKKALSKWWLNPESVNDLEHIYEWWKIPFERRWEYNPSRDRINDKIKDCLNNGQNQVKCLLDYAKHPFYKSCIGYVDQNNNILDTCSNSTHQSLRYCSSSGGECGFSLPKKHENSRGFWPISSSAIWDFTHPEDSIQRLKTFLDLKIPIMISIKTPDQFYNPIHGFMSNKLTGNHGGHAVLIVGYINNNDLIKIMPSWPIVPIGNGGGYFIVKNSWGTCYGDSGYVYLPYNSLKNSIKTAYVIEAIGKKL